ncbi:hypothetical protein H6P81_002962 [Aristolochia fimbriata]|uniref:Reverse transcriptase domain-containing protein n=1 Tax=Aristolochia fimbriata TaxID=158543 RepID=A0AAV7FD13_ARIFI|nr:hypothetical protein H6P81_002962 [Aristolochia fimbriata]
MENGLEGYSQNEEPFYIEETEELGNNSKLNMVKELELKEDRTSNETPKLELKPLPDSLKYIFLEKDSNPVIISSSLTDCEEDMLVKVLKQHKKAIGWSISDLKGISPTMCMHKILMEDTFKPIVQPQRRLNPAMQEAVKKEVIKLLDKGTL